MPILINFPSSILVEQKRAVKEDETSVSVYV